MNEMRLYRDDVPEEAAQVSEEIRRLRFALDRLWFNSRYQGGSPGFYIVPEQEMSRFYDILYGKVNLPEPGDLGGDAGTDPAPKD